MTTTSRRSRLTNGHPDATIVPIPVLADDVAFGSAGLSAAALAAAYVGELQELLAELDLAAVERIARVLHAARASGSTVFIAGNGGSAATAAHWVNDLAKATRSDSLRHMRVIGLVDNVPWITALANDEGYERVFAGQVENLGRRGDVLIVISASGNSPNILAAMRTARMVGMSVLALLGFDGGLALDGADDAVWVRTESGKYGLVESVHSIVADLVTNCLVAAGPDSRT